MFLAKRILKTVIFITLAIVFLVFGFIGGLLMRPTTSTVSSINFTSFDMSSIAGNLTPLTIEQATDRPYTRTEHVYNGQGQRLFVLEGSNMVVSQAPNGNVNLVTVDESDRNMRGLMVVHNPNTDEFLDGAERTLTIWLDSMDRAILRGGLRETIPISLDRDVGLIQRRVGRDTYVPIFSLINRQRVGFWNTINPWGRYFLRGGYRYNFFDVTGQSIPSNEICTRVDGWATTTNIVAGIMNPIRFAIHGNPVIHVANIFQQTTLRELMQEMSHVAYHPWPRIRDVIADRYVVAQDGHYVFLNPRTNQITDRFGYPMFSMNNRGFPVIFLNYDLITVDGRPQEVNNGVILNVMSTHGLLQAGREFHLGIIDVPDVGAVTVVMFPNGGGGWYSPTGDDVTSYVRGQEVWTIENTFLENIMSWFRNNMLALTFGGLIAWIVLATIGILLLFIICRFVLPIFLPGLAK